MKIKSKLFPYTQRSLKSFLPQVVGCVLFLFIATACGSFIASPPTKTTTPSGKKKTTRYQKLVSENEAIRKESETIKNQLKNLKEIQKQNSENFEQRLRNMDETIQLMEKNFDQPPLITTKPSPSVIKKSLPEVKPLRTKQAKQTENRNRLDINNAESESGFSTPDDSKAVESIFLFTPPPIPIPQQPERLSSHSSTNSIDQKQNSVLPLVEKEEETWDDPDLNPPVSPIELALISGAKSSYKEAFKVFAKKDYNRAITRFEIFLNQFPNDQDVDNSQFWIGQAYFNQKNYFLSETSFRKVLKNYPHGETRNGYKTADSILMLGRIYFQRSRPIRSRYYFKKVVELYPNSRSAFKARKELESMDSF